MKQLHVVTIYIKKVGTGKPRSVKFAVIARDALDAQELAMRYMYGSLPEWGPDPSLKVVINVVQSGVYKIW